MKILLAIDDSHSAAAPIREAATRSWPEGTVVRVMTVLEPIPSAAYIPEAPMVPLTSPLELQVQQDEALGMVASVGRMLAPQGLIVETVVRQGAPGRTIVEEAAEWGADLILIGSHGRTGLRRVLMGSVAQYVTAHARCSVEVVRSGPGEEEHAPEP